MTPGDNGLTFGRVRSGSLLCVAMCGCFASAPPQVIVALTDEPCVNDFVLAAKLPYLMRIDIGPPVRSPDGGTPLRFFEVSYGSAHDCPAGCFFSGARGVARGCDAIGWYEVSDYERTPRDRFRSLPADTRDALLFDGRLWDELTRTDRGALRTLLDWIQRRSDVPLAVMLRARTALAKEYQR